MSESGKPKGVHWAVKAFVLFHMLMVFTWSMPHFEGKYEAEVLARPIGEKITRPVDTWVAYNRQIFQNRDLPFANYMMSTGLWQGWDMFAPNPADTDLYVDAVLTLPDGSEKVFDLYRIKSLPIPQKYVYERFRKYRERLSDDGYRWKWPQTAKWFALRAYRETGEIPTKVVLRRHWQVIQPPGQSPLTEYLSYDFFETLIKPSEIKEMAGK